MSSFTFARAPRRARRGVFAAALPAALVVAALAGGEAHAATASMADGTLNHRALSGERNSVVAFDESSSTVRLSDNAGLRAGAGCLQIDSKSVRCGNVARLDIRTSDQTDTFVVQTGKPATYDAGSGDDGYHWNANVAKATSRVDYRGGSGRDEAIYFGATAGVVITKDGVANDGRTITGGTQTIDRDNVRSDVERLVGSKFNDSLNGSNSTSVTEHFDGREGSDIMSGNAGPDVFDQSVRADGADFMAGGSGVDAVDYSARPNRVVATLLSGSSDDGEAGERDDLKTIEKAYGGRGDDFLTAGSTTTTGLRLVGNAGNDVLLGSNGIDFLDGGANSDTLSAKGGMDTLRANDGTRDTIDCGTAFDQVARDLTEFSVTGCETQTRV